MSSRQTILYYLLDTNLFRVLTTSQHGKAIVRFNECLDAYPFLRNEKETAIKLTPFGLLEAIGGVPPKVSAPEIPRELYCEKPAIIANFLIQEYLKKFEAEPTLNASYLMSKANIQRTYTAPEAYPIFDICISHPIKQADFDRTIKQCLAYDHLFKFQFDRELSMRMHHHFLVLLLIQSPMLCHSGKFRIVRRIWEQVYPKLLGSSPELKEILVRINKSMSIKNAQDYFDCDLVSFLCHGYYGDSDNHSVVAFTQDDRQVIADRISVYKGIFKNAKEMCEPAALSSLHFSVLEPSEGILVSCVNDCSFSAPLPVCDVPAVM